MFGQNREDLRRFFLTSWNKRSAGQPLQPLERLVAEVIEQHPEYHAYLGDEDQLQQDFGPEQGQTNPWLHMGMHITIGEQLGADRPPGIRSAYQRLVLRHGDSHAVEHAMMECLSAVLWEAQRSGTAPDEQAYLACVKKLAR
ncbi:MAG: DUF1841 family protein [Deltaproteobacteria bacterium]|jgi:hypothetical protein|nr:DUF1841 family protein [Deltaproteobacteria bacterium]